MTNCWAHNCNNKHEDYPQGLPQNTRFLCPEHAKSCRVQGCADRRAYKIDLQENHSKYCTAHVCQYPDCCCLRVSVENGTRYCHEHECIYGECTRLGPFDERCIHHRPTCSIEGCTGFHNRISGPRHWFCPIHTCRENGCVQSLKNSSVKSSLYCWHHACKTKGCWAH